MEPSNGNLTARGGSDSLLKNIVRGLHARGPIRATLKEANFESGCATASHP